MSKVSRAGVRSLLAFCLLPLISCAREDAPRPESVHRGAYQANILEMTHRNDAFRRVLFTGARTQMVVMSIPPGGDIGEETHGRVEQILFCASGSGQVVLDGKRSPFGPGDVVVVTPGTRHNFLNTGTAPLEIYTIYAPPNHLHGRVQATKADAEADVEDQALGRRVEAVGADVEP